MTAYPEGRASGELSEHKKGAFTASVQVIQVMQGLANQQEQQWHCSGIEMRGLKRGRVLRSYKPVAFHLSELVNLG